MQPARQNPVDKALEKVGDALAGIVGAVTAATAGSHDFQAFVLEAAIGHRYEIEAGGFVAETAAAPEIRGFAGRLVQEHAAALAELQRAAQALSGLVEDDPLLDGRRQGLVDHLRSLTVDEVPQRFVAQQVMALREAVRLHRGFAAHGDRPTLREQAAATLPMLEQELAIAEALKGQAH